MSAMHIDGVTTHHDDVIKWEHFQRNWPFVRGIHRSPVNSPHKGQWRGALMFSLICAWTNGCTNIRDAGDLRRHGAHYDVTVMRCHWVLYRFYWFGKMTTWRQYGYVESTYDCFRWTCQLFSVKGKHLQESIDLSISHPHVDSRYFVNWASNRCRTFWLKYPCNVVVYCIMLHW